MRKQHLLYLFLVLATFTKASDNANPDSVEVAALCARFYNEVCYTALSAPAAVESEKGYYVLDLESYKTALGKTGLFTEAFIAARDSVFEECATALEQEKITPGQAWEGGIEMNAPYNCGFLNANYYFNAQEDPDGFRLDDMVISDSAAFVVIRYYSGDWTWNVFLTIELVKAADGWYIDKAEKLFEEE